MHVGDIGPSAARRPAATPGCEARKKQFARIRHPFVLVPGDNEWSDCRTARSERAAALAALFCVRAPSASAGECCEHRALGSGRPRVRRRSTCPGNNNNLRHAEHAPRMRAVLAWLDESRRARREARRPGRAAAGQPVLRALRRATATRSCATRLRRSARRLPGRLVLIHGDTHIHRDDEPLPGLRRIEVWGSPFVSWLRASVAGGVLGGDARDERAPGPARPEGHHVARPTGELLAAAVGLGAQAAGTPLTPARLDELLRQHPRNRRQRAIAAFLKDERDTTSPEAYTAMLAMIWQGKALSAPQTALLLDIMHRCATGQGRLPAGLPRGARIARKTGTLRPFVTNDAGIVALPGNAGHVALRRAGARVPAGPEGPGTRHRRHRPRGVRPFQAVTPAL